MELTQNGNEVTGYYFEDNGKLSGTLKGNTLTGTWHETGNDTGKFQFSMSSDAESFSGKWGRKNGPLEYDWNGRRAYEKRH